MILYHEAEHASQWQEILSIAAKIGCTGQNEWLNQAERDSDRKPGLTTDMAARLNALARPDVAKPPPAHPHYGASRNLYNGPSSS